MLQIVLEVLAETHEANLEFHFEELVVWRSRRASRHPFPPPSVSLPPPPTSPSSDHITVFQSPQQNYDRRVWAPTREFMLELGMISCVRRKVSRLTSQSQINEYSSVDAVIPMRRNSLLGAMVGPRQ
jgi:hypothetical protein